MELRGLYGAHIRSVRLIQERRKLAEDRAGLRYRGDLSAALDDADRAAFENEQLPGSAAFSEHGLAGAVAGERKRGKPSLPSFGFVDRRHGQLPPLLRSMTMTF